MSSESGAANPRVEEREQSKYGHLLPDDEPIDPQPDPDSEIPAKVDIHAVYVHHKTDPERTNGYRYQFHISHGHRWDPVAIPLARERWAGNFWRKCDDLDDEDWEDIPYCVREKVTEVVEGAHGPADLNPVEVDDAF